MATECIKNCCKIFLNKDKEPDPEIITVHPIVGAPETRVKRSTVGVTEDYLLSKLPPDGKEVPFVLPSIRPSYIQPQGFRYPSYQGGLHSSARTTYSERKAELAGAGQLVYDPSAPFHPSHVMSYISPRAVRRPILRGGHVPAFEQSVKQRLSASMLDLSSPQSQIQRYDSVTSVLSSTSSMQDSFGSSRSIESGTMSSDEKERELGKVCVMMSYQEAVEQVWITLVQCKDLCVSRESSEQQRVGFKGVITMAKPVQFKTSVKEATPDLVFMETFVFTLNLEQLRSSALVLRLQTHTPRKRTQGECVLSLRTLEAEETLHWLDLSPPCKNHVCHAELQLSTCFQPVNSRIQLQILAAQDLPSSTSFLTQSFFVKVEMFSDGRFVVKKKTKLSKVSGGQVQWGETVMLPISNQDHDIQLLIKLYSRGSLRRKYLLGQGHIVHNWKVRWFVLKADQLIYYRYECGKPDSCHRGSVPLVNCDITCPYLEYENRPLVLRLKTKSSDVYFLEACSREERDEWAAEISAAVQRLWLGDNTAPAIRKPSQSVQLQCVNLSEVVDSMHDVHSGIKMSSHSEQGSTYINCFSGSAVVDWMVFSHLALTRVDAVTLASALLDEGSVRAVGVKSVAAVRHNALGEQFLDDSTALYSFAEGFKKRGSMKAEKALTSEMCGRVQKRGYLIKQGHKVKNWKVRLFVLRSEPGFLHYYDPSKDDITPAGGFALRGCLVSSLDDNGIPSGVKGKVKGNLFKIITQNDRHYFIQAPTHQEKMEWIDAIKRHT